MQISQEEFFNFLRKNYGQKNILTIPVELLKKFDGDYQEALFLSQLIYWADKTTDMNGWIYKSYKDWEEELFIKEKKARSVKEHLESLKIIETKKEKINGAPVIHYRIIKENLIKFLTSENNEYLEEKNLNEINNTDNQKNESLEMKNGNGQKAEWKPPKGGMETAQKENGNGQKAEWKPPKRPNGNRPNGGMETVKMAGSLNTDITNRHYKQILPHHHDENHHLPNRKKTFYEEFLEEKLISIDLQKFKDLTTTLYSLLLKQNLTFSKDFKSFIKNDLKKGLLNLRLNNLNFDDDVVEAFKNYSKILDLQKQSNTWWKTELDFPTFCKKSINRFLPQKFDITLYMLDKSKLLQNVDVEDDVALPF